jgi:hypothetical protein
MAMPREQVRGKEVEARTASCPAGADPYELATGRRPFGQRAPNSGYALGSRCAP